MLEKLYIFVKNQTMYKILIALFCWTTFYAQTNEIQKAETFQKNMNASFADANKSPLLEDDLKSFEGLDFFPISEQFIVKATFIRTKKEKPFQMKTTTERTPMYKKFGELHFELNGQKMQLNVYQNLELIQKPGFKDYLFLPFSDVSCGKESYIGGRYIDLRIPKSKEVIINFNLAYNPYCAYNYKYSCPIVPLENDLPIAILAGVKKFND
jgi:uncharacterized protein (DUF1684 family)